MKAARYALVIAVAGAAACGGDQDDGLADVEIRIEPADAVVTVSNGASEAQAYSATIVYADGTQRDVSDDVVWSVVDPVGSFEGTTFEASGQRAAHTQVQAQLGTGPDAVAGSADLTVRIEQQRVEAPAPSEAPGWFDSASDDPALAPSIVYPTFGTVVPPNFGAFEVHWQDAGAADLYEVAVVTELVDLRVYTLDPSPTIATFSAAEWQVVASTHRGESVELEVAAMNSADTAVMGRSEPSDVHLAFENVTGGIYYWAPSPAGIYRHDFEAVDEPAELVFDNNGGCAGCHGLSRDGTLMGLTLQSGNGPGAIVDVATMQPIAPSTSMNWNFATFSPEGDKVLTVWNGQMTVREATTAAELKGITGPSYATHPDWSPSGDFIVYTDATSPSTDYNVSGASIYRLNVDSGGEPVGSPIELAPSMTQNAYYPAISPDNQWILFNASASSSYDDSTAELYAVAADGSGEHFKLDAPNVSTGLTNSWPRWAPFTQTEKNGERVFWFTFSSTRQVGVQPAGQSQIWMAAFYPDRAAAGEPASAPAFRLPFQDFATSNHSAQWTTRIVDIIE